MDWPNWITAVSTVVIAIFAFTTWRQTRQMQIESEKWQAEVKEVMIRMTSAIIVLAGKCDVGIGIHCFKDARKQYEDMERDQSLPGHRGPKE